MNSLKKNKTPEKPAATGAKAGKTAKAEVAKKNLYIQKSLTQAKPAAKPSQPLEVATADFSEEQVNHLKSQFEKVDIDKNGFLTERELNVFLRRLKIYIADEAMAKLMKVADVDGDGMISMTEFLEAAKGTSKETSVLQQL